MTTGDPKIARAGLLSPPESIETARLMLRRPHFSDADDIFDNYATDPEVTRYLIWQPYKHKGDLLPFLQSLLDKWNTGNEYTWAITRAEEDLVIGMIACRMREHAADIGYVLGRSFWNRGYITEAAEAVVEWALNLNFIYRVWAVCDVENKASARVLAKVGMQREGILRRYIVHPNVSCEPRDCFVYSKIR